MLSEGRRERQLGAVQEREKAGRQASVNMPGTIRRVGHRELSLLFLPKNSLETASSTESWTAQWNKTHRHLGVHSCGTAKHGTKYKKLLNCASWNSTKTLTSTSWIHDMCCLITNSELKSFHIVQKENNLRASCLARFTSRTERGSLSASCNASNGKGLLTLAVAIRKKRVQLVRSWARVALVSSGLAFELVFRASLDLRLLNEFSTFEPYRLFNLSPLPIFRRARSMRTHACLRSSNTP